MIPFKLKEAFQQSSISSFRAQVSVIYHNDLDGGRVWASLTLAGGDWGLSAIERPQMTAVRKHGPLSSFFFPFLHRNSKILSGLSSALHMWQ